MFSNVHLITMYGFAIEGNHLEEQSWVDMSIDSPEPWAQDQLNEELILGGYLN